jgi:hypothetical protein
LPQIDLTTALAALLTDRDALDLFHRDALAAAEKLQVRAEHHDAFIAIDPMGLEAQAATLINKRFCETAKLLPLTFLRLGDAAENLFLNYAQSHWPVGHRRHLLDAIEFAQLLRARGEPLEENELHRVRFLTRAHRFSLTILWEANYWLRLPALQLLTRNRRGDLRVRMLRLAL